MNTRKLVRTGQLVAVPNSFALGQYDGFDFKTTSCNRLQPLSCTAPPAHGTGGTGGTLGKIWGQFGRLRCEDRQAFKSGCL